MKIINNMLDFSKIGSDRFVLENVAFNLKELVTKALDQFQPKAQMEKIKFSYRIETEIPKDLYGDPLRINQVIKHLLNNALKFSPEGEIEFRVKKEAEDQYKIDFHFFVADTGIGIPKEKQDEIFEAFTQADGSMTREYGGTGLGTSISKKLVEMMGGKIWVESPNPKSKAGSPGSIFHFIISLRKVKKHSDLGKEQKRAKDKPNQTFKKDIHCLLVEDNPINQKIITRIINNYGVQVDLAENGKIGVDKVKKRNYDIIFMDVQMPVMSGLEATKKIKEMGVKTPIIALTAHALKEHQEVCFDTGMDGYISKPVKKDQIFSAFKKFVY
jgi:CheY-like chemotaxis protein